MYFFSLHRASFIGGIIGILTAIALGWLAEKNIPRLGVAHQLAYSGLGGLLAASLYALTADRCEMDGLFRSYGANLQQFCESVFSDVAPEHAKWNPHRRLAVFLFPLALGPLIVAVGATALQLGQWVYKQEALPERDLATFLVVAWIATAITIVFGYATADWRKRGLAPPDQSQL